MPPTLPLKPARDRPPLTGLAATVYTIIVPGSLTVLVPWLVLRTNGSTLAAHSAWQHLGWAPLALGAVLVIRCARDFVVRGHGTPAPHAAPTALVANGFYRWTRNPMYVGVLSMLLAEALLWWSSALLWYAAGTWVTMHVFVVSYEEATLRRRFGVSYAAYCATVPRWLGRVRRQPPAT
jgi:protein-S-isoprenylcysteine O-methyltransferase Ste14